MVLTISNITIAQGATILNVLTTFIQYTLGLAIIAILVYILPASNSANTWTIVAREVHASSWSALVQNDSAAASVASTRVRILSKASLISTILVAISAAIAPLGLKVGPTLLSAETLNAASHVQDTSPIGLATSPRQNYTYDRICGSFDPVACPGNGDNGNTSVISPEIIQRFNSTPWGPFSMQFRRFFTGRGGYNYTMTYGSVGIVESFILREDMFIVDGLVVDLGDSPGVGLLNHTIPTNIPHGATWSQDILWLEPETTCVNMNLTLDYVIDSQGSPKELFNLTDRGGFVNLTRDYPQLNRDGQIINLYEHAYKGAVLSIDGTLQSFNNMTRNESYIGKAFTLNHSDILFQVGKAQSIGNVILSNDTIFEDQEVSCSGFGGADTANITNVSVHCGIFIGPPRRSDGGDPGVPSENSTWTQNFHGCASAMRASIQRIRFSLNTTRDFSSIQIISRTPIDQPVYWAVEKTNVLISDVDLYWGIIDERYENDPTLSTIRRDHFYLPAGSTDIWDAPSAGTPNALPQLALNELYNAAPSFLPDYSGASNYALLRRYLSLIDKDLDKGTAQMKNLIVTDFLANIVVGSHSNSSLFVARHVPSVAYDIKYAIPLLLLFALWAPSFIMAIVLLLFRRLKISHIRDLLVHTSVGRVVMGHSALVPVVHNVSECLSRSLPVRYS
ncbi:hypothetical protein M422DRAFT_189643 [Sphaerobolus stellatus SS14]|uniref:Uncharacterized protein n=1 Tax=Sphaerobolus stellatus (strain SS14) TaxID=990650 RepID=A0A0C9UTM7_SPHS4|nr:hypothetical protein M422DRAFT_189643 [Sphaerobolus stellatus SS14]